VNDTASASAPASQIRVRGEPLSTLPQDLYIPPDALEVFLETFEGPLDLLLYLIRKQNLDILDIPIARITDQYMEYIAMMKEMRFELAAEYLLMAAMLAEIKSRMLLPRPVTEEDEGDPRAELIRRLQEYERYRTAAEQIDQLPRIGRELFEVTPEPPPREARQRFPEVELRDLLDALRGVLQRAELFTSHQVQREALSVRERMSELLDRLQSDRFTEFSTLFDPEEGRLGIVVTFLAILELAKGALIELVQNAPYGPIHLKSRGRRGGIAHGEATA
jgi:segregation and condensation protein A